MRLRAFSRLLLALAVAYAASPAVHGQETIVYSFTGANDDAAPMAGLVPDSKGNLFGTTCGNQGHGTVFELSPAEGGKWSEIVLYAFEIGPDGAGCPEGDLVLDPQGNIYGTAEDGGIDNCGIVFELIRGSGGVWSEKTLHKFEKSSTDGCTSHAGLIFDQKGNLYGATTAGGNKELGVVFELLPGSSENWTEKILWNFAGNPTDGALPYGKLAIDKQGNLYGTTAEGGVGTVYNSGTVFELRPQTNGTWQESILYTFGQNAKDADGPQVGLTFDSKGNLFGTAWAGGGTNDNGAVFELTPGTSGIWTERVIHSFSLVGTDGNQPEGGVILDLDGNLFGTTFEGGSSPFYGTVYELRPQPDGTWHEEILFDFGPQGGSAPMGLLAMDRAGNLYGTTDRGSDPNGTYYGDGTVFEIFNPDRTGTPAFSVPAGMYTSAQTVKLSDYSAGATIYYTTDGALPTTSSEKYSTAIKVGHTETIKALAVAPNLSESEVATARYTIELTTATPVISPKGGTYTTIQHVTITCATSGAEIFYTTNGAMPTATSKRYVGPIKVAASEVIKAIATAKGFTPSGVATASYTIHLPPTATPVFSPAGGTYPKTQSVTISDATSGAEIYYTTNGDTPTASSSRYYGTPISVGKTKTLKAIAFDAGHTESKVASATYTIQ